MSHEITICYATDQVFAPCVGASILSVLTNAAEGDHFHFYILDQQISEAAKQKIASLKERFTFALTFLPFDASIFEPIVRNDTSGWRCLPTFARFLIPTMMEEPKVLYLDGDTFVRHSLRDLWNTDIGEAYIGGVPDYNLIKTEHYFTNLFGPKFNKKEYLNAGILLINNRLWKQDHLFERLMDFSIKNAAFLQAADQDPINFVCQGRKVLLPERYNVRNYMYMPDLFAHLPRYQEILQETKDPVIRHFHPWRKNFFVAHREEWKQMMAHSPWPELIAQDDPPLKAWIKIFGRYLARHPFFYLLPRFYKRLKARGWRVTLLDH